MTRMTGHRYIAEALKAYEVDHIFHVPTILLPAFAEMEGMGITRLSAHSEGSAAYMADGYARASHKPGIAMAQTVGAANLAAGLQDPYLASIPVIAITGGRMPNSKYRHVYQEVEAFRMYEPVTKFNAQVDDVARLPDMIRQAFRVATTGTPGPVHLELPGATGAIDAEFEVSDVLPMAEEQFKRFPALRTEADADAVRAAARHLRDAQRPIIVAGGGVKSSGAQAEINELAELLSIPVATSMNAKGTISETSDLAVGVVGSYARLSANRTVSEADLVFYVGSQTSSQVTNNWRTPEIGKATVIQLDINPTELGRNYPNAVSLLGDAKTTLRRIIEASEPVTSRTAWLNRVKQLNQEWRAEKAALINSDQEPIRPERILKEISDVLPSDGTIVADTGHAGMWTGGIMDMKQGQTYLRAAGSLGWSYPASLGAKCGTPNKDVICFTGDGGFLYHLPELETALRYGINTVTVINNNFALNQETEGMNRAYKGNQYGGAHQMWMFEKLNYKTIAEAFGCVGFRVEKPGDIRGAIEAALTCGKPAIVDVVSDITALADTTSVYG